MNKKRSLAVLIACYWHALRPWSFLASIQAMLVSIALCHAHHSKINPLTTIWTAVIVLMIHAAANITNTYHDYIKGVDTIESSHDRTLVDRHLEPQQIRRFMYILYILSVSLLVNLAVSQAQIIGVDEWRSFMLLAATGVVLAWAYTAPPLQLKYRGLGDVCIFVAYGPALVMGFTFMQTRTLSTNALIFSIPGGLVVEGILHVNNTRDVLTDAKANAVTLPQLLGTRGSRYMYYALFITAYSTLLCLSYYHARPLLFLLPSLTIFQAFDLCERFSTQAWSGLPERTGQFSFVFGCSIAVSIWLSGVGS